MSQAALLIGKFPQVHVQVIPCTESRYKIYCQMLLYALSQKLFLIIIKIKFILCSQQPSTPKTSAKKDDVKKAGSKTPQPVRH